MLMRVTIPVFKFSTRLINGGFSKVLKNLLDILDLEHDTIKILLRWSNR